MCIKQIIISIFITILFLSCNDRIEEKAVIDETSIQLQTVNGLLQDESNRMVVKWKFYLDDPTVSMYALRFYPKADSIQRITNEFYNYLDTIRLYKSQKMDKPNLKEVQKEWETYLSVLYKIDSSIQGIIDSPLKRLDTPKTTFDNLSSEAMDLKLIGLQSKIRLIEFKTLKYFERRVTHLP